MIARPLQATALEARGLSSDAIGQSLATARLEMTLYEVDSYVPQTDEYVFEVPAGSSETEVAATLLATGAFQYVEPDWLLYPIQCSDDQFLGLSWQHTAMRSCDAWDQETGSPTVSIGICDTGVLTTHDDLQLHRLEGYNAVDQQWESQGGSVLPVHPHGTQCTGSAAANGNNGVGVSGIGWNLSHRMMRVSNVSTGSASLSVLQHAARTSIEAGDKIASVSYSGADTNSNLTTASYIRSLGGLLFWAAGNDNRNLTFGNRDNDDLMVVGATSENETRASFSAYGQFVDFMAPGDAVATTSSTSNSSYVYATGTSFACPIAAGLAGLIWSADPNLTPGQVESIMKQGATDLGSAGVDNTFGYGRLDSLGSLNLVNGGGSTPPVADFSGAPTSGTVPLTVTFSDSSQNGPASWNWSFGDGNNSASQNPSYTYTTAGTYSVSLTVTNADGTDTLTRTDYVVVNPDAPQPPVADFVATPTSGTTPLNVSFTDQSTNNPNSWSWDFGDGSTSTAQEPGHIYTSVGSYTVSLTVSNSDGSDTQTLTNYITVSAPSGGDILGDGFESGSFATNAWMPVGNADVSAQSAFTGTYGARLRRGSSIEVAVSTAGRTGVTLSYARRTRRLDGGERLTVEWYDGSVWRAVETHSGGWGTPTFSLGSGADNNPNLRLRFSLNANRNNEHAYIDDVVLSAD
ncbi:PKD domain-containing protein [Saltatorellus ferox]